MFIVKAMLFSVLAIGLAAAVFLVVQRRVSGLPSKLLRIATIVTLVFFQVCVVFALSPILFYFLASLDLLPDFANANAFEWTVQLLSKLCAIGIGLGIIFLGLLLGLLSSGKSKLVVPPE